MKRAKFGANAKVLELEVLDSSEVQDLRIGARQVVYQFPRGDSLLGPLHLRIAIVGVPVDTIVDKTRKPGIILCGSKSVRGLQNQMNKLVSIYKPIGEIGSVRLTPPIDRVTKPNSLRTLKSFVCFTWM